MWRERKGRLAGAAVRTKSKSGAELNEMPERWRNKGYDKVWNKQKKAAAFSLKLLCVPRRLELGEGYLFLTGLHFTVKLG